MAVIDSFEKFAPKKLSYVRNDAQTDGRTGGPTDGHGLRFLRRSKTHGKYLKPFQMEIA